MASLASDLLGRTKETFNRMTSAQRWLAGLLGLALATAVGVGYYLNRDQWVELIRNGEPQDVASVVAQLQELNVPMKPVGDGYTILVPLKERDAARLALVGSGVVPKGTAVGMEIFDEPKFGATEFDRKVNYLRARQGELERTLLRNSDLEFARVHLDIPEQSVFVRSQQEQRAAVLLQPRSGKKLSPEQVQGIVTFVASSVNGLKPESVTVVDQTGRLLSSGLNTTIDPSQSLDPDQIKRQDEMQRQMERKILTMLEGMFGAGNVTVGVSLELNMEAAKVETSTIGQAAPKATTTEREAATGSGVTAGQATRPNEPGAPPVYQGAQSTQGAEDLWKSKSTTTYEHSSTREVRVVPPGSVKRISASVGINRTDLTTEEINKIKAMVANAAGADTSAIAVVAMSFNRELPPALVAQPQPNPLEPRTLALGLGTAAAVLMFGYVVTRRRRPQEPEEEEPLLMEMPKLGSSGGLLDVALGMPGAQGMPAGFPPGQIPGAMSDPMTGQMPGGMPGGMPGAMADQMGASMSGVTPGGLPPTDLPAERIPGTVPYDPNNPQQRLELVMQAKPKRQVVIDGTPVDDQLMQLIEDLIINHPETAAETIRDWLKGGSGSA